MASSQPHNVFLITEILELILLETETRTLLTSAQRVCRKWHLLIQDERLTGCPVFQARELYSPTRDSRHSQPVTRGMYMAVVLRKASTRLESTTSRRRGEDTSDRSSERSTLFPRRRKLERNVISATSSFLYWLHRERWKGC